MLQWKYQNDILKNMQNKNISTLTGSVILVIIAITAGTFVWVYEKGQDWNTDLTGIQPRVTSKQAAKDDKSSSGEITAEKNQDLKKYVSSDYNFSFQYPSDLTISSISTEKQVTLARDNGNGHWVYTVIITDNTKNLSLQQAFEQEVNKVNYDTVKSDTLIDGKPAKIFSAQKSHDYGNAGIVFLFKGKIMTIFGDDSSFEGKNKFDVFIKTFHFDD